MYNILDIAGTLAFAGNSFKANKLFVLVSFQKFQTIIFFFAIYNKKFFSFNLLVYIFPITNAAFPSFLVIIKLNYGWEIFHCVYIPQLLYPFIYRWTSRLLPCSSYLNNAAVNNGIHVSLLVLVSSGICQGVGFLGDGEGDRRELQNRRDICIPMADSCWVFQKTAKFCKAIILQ